MVGAGDMARAHSVALTPWPSCIRIWRVLPRLVVVSDVNRSAGDRPGRPVRLRACRGGLADALVTADDVDLVVACLPPVLNREVVLAAAAAGKHVVCEKPLAGLGRGGGRDARGLSDRRRLPRPRRRLPLDARPCGRSGA